MSQVVLAAIDAATILIIIPLITIPIAAFVFASGAGKALSQVGKGALAIDQDVPAAGHTPVSKAVRETEIRQMLEARSYRAQARGEAPVDVDAEMEKLLAPERAGGGLGADQGLRQEVRDLVVARNERRERAGKKPLDIEKEIDRQLAELEDLA